MLNLYTRVDTNKDIKQEIEHPDYPEYLQTLVEKHSDFLIVFGQAKNEGEYKFIKKAKEVKDLLNSKNVLRLNLPDANYAPHSGNPKILYNNINFDVTAYDFSDIK